MDIPLQRPLTVPVTQLHQMQPGAVTDTVTPQKQAQVSGIPTPPHALGTLAAVNKARISRHPSSPPAITPIERVLKPYNVTMLPHSETTENLVQHTA